MRSQIFRPFPSLSSWSLLLGIRLNQHSNFRLLMIEFPGRADLFHVHLVFTYFGYRLRRNFLRYFNINNCNVNDWLLLVYCHSLLGMLHLLSNNYYWLLLLRHKVFPMLSLQILVISLWNFAFEMIAARWIASPLDWQLFTNGKGLFDIVCFIVWITASEKRKYAPASHVGFLD